MGACNDLKRQLTLCLRAEVCILDATLTLVEEIESTYERKQSSREKRKNQKSMERN
jgi:hypothetical protein